MWHWYIVVLGSRDYYLNYSETIKVKARTQKEAERKALNGCHAYIEVASTWDCGECEPTECPDPE